MQLSPLPFAALEALPKSVKQEKELSVKLSETKPSVSTEDAVVYQEMEANHFGSY